MIKHIWSVLCKESIINQDDNIMTLYSVLEELTITLPPNSDNPFKQQNKVALPINYEVTSYWIKSENDKEEKANVEVVLFDPKGEKLNQVNINLVIPANIKRYRTRAKTAGLTVQGEGEYKLQVNIKHEGQEKFIKVAEIPLDIKIKIAELNKQAQEKN